jgi:hypothetical protein
LKADRLADLSGSWLAGSGTARLFSSVCHFSPNVSV